MTDLEGAERDTHSFEGEHPSLNEMGGVLEHVRPVIVEQMHQGVLTAKAIHTCNRAYYRGLLIKTYKKNTCTSEIFTTSYKG